MNAVHPVFASALQTVSPYSLVDARHQSEEDRAVEYRDWKDERLAYWHAHYLADGDLADALGSLDNGIELGRAIFKAAQAFEEGMVHRLIIEAMDKAAAEFAAVKVAREENFRERMREDDAALVRAYRHGKVPAGYDD